MSKQYRLLLPSLLLFVGIRSRFLSTATTTTAPEQSPLHSTGPLNFSPSRPFTKGACSRHELGRVIEYLIADRGGGGAAGLLGCAPAAIGRFVYRNCEAFIPVNILIG